MSDTPEVVEPKKKPRTKTDDRLSIDVDIDGKTTTLRFTSLNKVPIELLRTTRHDRTEQMWQIFEWAFTAEELEKFGTLPGGELMAIMAAMQQASQVELGE